MTMNQTPEKKEKKRSLSANGSPIAIGLVKTIASAGSMINILGYNAIPLSNHLMI